MTIVAVELEEICYDGRYISDRSWDWEPPNDGHLTHQKNRAVSCSPERIHTSTVYCTILYFVGHNIGISREQGMEIPATVPSCTCMKSMHPTRYRASACRTLNSLSTPMFGAELELGITENKRGFPFIGFPTRADITGRRTGENNGRSITTTPVFCVFSLLSFLMSLAEVVPSQRLMWQNNG